jgi:hypothetical protein
MLFVLSRDAIWRLTYGCAKRAGTGSAHPFCWSRHPRADNAPAGTCAVWQTQLTTDAVAALHRSSADLSSLPGAISAKAEPTTKMYRRRRLEFSLN